MIEVGHYDAELFKKAIKAQGFNPTEFIMVVCGINNYQAANRKLAKGRFDVNEIYKIGSQLDITPTQFCKIFFRNCLVDTM